MKLQYNLLTIIIGLCLVACNQKIDIDVTLEEPQTHFQQAMGNVRATASKVVGVLEDI